MRTTLAIDDRLLESAKARAAASGQTLGAYVEEALRMRLTAAATSRTIPELPVFERGTGPAPGVDVSSNRGLFDALDESGDLM